MTSCRICYGEEAPDNPLVSPCDCRGSVEAMHKHCLGLWMLTSSATHCELCHARYHIEDMTFEPHVEVPVLVERLTTRAPAVFLIKIMLYILCTFQPNVRREETAIEAMLAHVSRAIPVLLIGLVGMQVVAFIPTFRGLRDGARYWRYTFSIHDATSPMNPSWLVFVIVLGIIASFFTPVGGICMVLTVVRKLREVHRHTLDLINRGILENAGMLPLPAPHE